MVKYQKPLLELEHVKKYFPIKTGLLRRKVSYIRAVDDVSLTVFGGETLGIVGESGCGKTTLGRCIVQLYDVTGGRIRLHVGDATLDVTNLDSRQMRDFRRNAQIIYQDPYSSLNPRLNVLETVGEPLLVNGIAKGRELEDRVKEMIVQVGLRVEHLRRFPHSFSGGQRQRIGIARALVVHPSLVVADEPVSALDVSIQAQILNLLKQLQIDLNLTYIFVSHDMSVIRYICDRIAVMYAGKLVELGPKTDLLAAPRHPYSELLLASVPRTSFEDRHKRAIATGELPDLTDLPSGCVFSSRCKYVQDRCKEEVPTLQPVDDGHYASCFYADELELIGIPGSVATASLPA